eukprot:CAMPEP_0202977506 /NCGR_PEP_ID=MMETSP1396-20130829/84285_1 /ASSEMBLY_ACC=CAM_ASM_000872 /TAXON_ID= /ORGANISM="Pseudokeronopsis sp., Strain Brazil" /LENGTH=137 /DNA_ID=CAMNT_0049716257 /DNA_START=17 /DNA_END=430 /DNA_ORIENTATION=+
MKAVLLISFLATLSQAAVMSAYNTANLCTQCLVNGHMQCSGTCYTYGDPYCPWGDGDNLLVACSSMLSTSSLCGSEKVVNYDYYETIMTDSVSLTPGQWCYFDIKNDLYSHHADEARMTWSLSNMGANLKVLVRNET